MHQTRPLVRPDRATAPLPQGSRRSEQLSRLVGQEQLADYVGALKQRVEVKVKPDLIEKK